MIKIKEIKVKEKEQVRNYAKIDMAPMGHHGMKNFTSRAIGTI